PLLVGALVPSGSKRSIRFGPGHTRLPVAPDHPSLPTVDTFYGYRLRINVPGSLRHRKLTVPQTSWNLLHHAPAGKNRQRVLRADCRFSSDDLTWFFMHIVVSARGRNVEKTKC